MRKHSKKVGLYGGSFDPLHFGHLNLAIELKEKGGLDEVWFCPAKISPFKLHLAPEVDGNHRLEMLKNTLNDIPGFRVLDIEVKREGPSYTVDTLGALHEQYPDVEFSLLMGEDSLAHFFKWHKAEEIVTLANLLVGMRSLDNKIDHVELTKTRIMDISSTEIRDRLKKRLYCGHLIPAKVLDFIYQNDLYL